MQKLIALALLILLLLTGCGSAAGQENGTPASETSQPSAAPAEVLRAAMDSAWEGYLASLVPELAGAEINIRETRSGSFSEAAANETFLLLSSGSGATVGLVIDAETFALVAKTTITADSVELYLFRDAEGRDYPLLQTKKDGGYDVALYSVTAKGWSGNRVDEKLSGLLNDEDRSVSCIIEDGSIIHVFDGDETSESIGERCEYLYSLRWSPDTASFAQYAISPYAAYVYEPQSGVIPDEVIAALTTPALAETVFNQFHAHQLSFMFGEAGEEDYLYWREHMSGLPELEARPDGFDALYWYYKLNFNEINAATWSGIEATLLFGEFTSEKSMQAQSQLDPAEMVSLYHRYSDHPDLKPRGAED